MIDNSYQNIVKTNNTSQNQFKRFPRFRYCNLRKLINATILFGKMHNIIIVSFGSMIKFSVSVRTAVSAGFEVVIYKNEVPNISILPFFRKMKASR